MPKYPLQKPYVAIVWKLPARSLFFFDTCDWLEGDVLGGKASFNSDFHSIMAGAKTSSEEAVASIDYRIFI